MYWLLAVAPILKSKKLSNLETDIVFWNIFVRNIVRVVWLKLNVSTSGIGWLDAKGRSKYPLSNPKELKALFSFPIKLLLKFISGLNEPLTEKLYSGNAEKSFKSISTIPPVKSAFNSALADLLIKILSRRLVGKISNWRVFLSGSRPGTSSPPSNVFEYLSPSPLT